MADSRIEKALARIEVAMARLDAVRFPEKAEGESAAKEDNPDKVIALANSHEKLREEVEATLQDLDLLIEQLEQ